MFSFDENESAEQFFESDETTISSGQSIPVDKGRSILKKKSEEIRNTDLKQPGTIGFLRHRVNFDLNNKKSQ